MSSTLQTHGKLESACLELLYQNPLGVSEHQLISLLRDDEVALLPALDTGDSLALFQQHFVLFHSLYRLRERLLHERHALLHISALSIRLTDYEEGEDGLCEADPLRDYYLDSDNLHTTGEAEVEEMLAGFWRRLYLGEPERVAAALEVLELESAESFSQIRRQYKLLVMRHHPDRGGRRENMHLLNEALEVMRAHFGA